MKSFIKKYSAIFLSTLFFMPSVSSNAEGQKESAIHDPSGKVPQTKSESEQESLSQYVHHELEKNPRAETTLIKTKVEAKTNTQIVQKPTILFNDISRLNPVYVREVLHPREIIDLQKAILQARNNNLKVSIAGKRHSQGGHIVYDGALVLDMRQFNRILSLDQKKKIVTVQSGASWEEVQNYINRYGLSIKVMQASNIFTVGGSLSSNVHGEDPRFGSIIETVKSFRLLLSDGSIVNASRTENAELFKFVIGGFGLFGIILDVDLELTGNDVYEGISEVMDYKNYPSFFEQQVKSNPIVGNHLAKLSIAPESFLKEVVVTTYRKIGQQPEKIFDLKQEKNIWRNKFFFGLSRSYDWGKSLRWNLQKKLEAKVGVKQVISRNNAMRPIVKFLDYTSNKNTDILQEYFIPKENLLNFIDELREIIKENKVNLLSATVRYVPKNIEAYLSYAKKESFAVVLYINQPISNDGTQQAQTWTHKIVDLALENEGSYYLTYQRYPTQEEIRRAYPQIESFFEKKKLYDPHSLFMNKFYEKYQRS